MAELLEGAVLQSVCHTASVLVLYKSSEIPASTSYGASERGGKFGFYNIFSFIYNQEKSQATELCNCQVSKGNVSGLVSVM